MKKMMLLVLLTSFVPAWAQSKKLAVVDMNRLIAECTPGKVMKTEMDALITQTRATLAKQEELLNSIKTQLQKADATKTAELTKQGQAAQIELKRMQEDGVKKLKSAEEAHLAKIEAILAPFMQEFLRAEGVDLLLSSDTPALVWADEKIDITSQVIAKYNSKNP